MYLMLYIYLQLQIECYCGPTKLRADDGFTLIFYLFSNMLKVISMHTNKKLVIFVENIIVGLFTKIFI